MPMYTIPLIFGALFAWPVVGAILFVSLDTDNNELYYLIKNQKNRIIRNHHIFVWPYVLWLWFKKKKYDKEELEKQIALLNISLMRPYLLDNEKLKRHKKQ